MWEKIDRCYGKCTWDYPTLYVTFPGLADLHSAIKAEGRRRYKERKEYANG